MTGNSTPSIIGPDVTITGNVKTNGELQLDGSIDGDLVCNNITMGEKGSLIGTVKADSVTVRGAVKGEIHGRSVRLEATAVVEGDIYHEVLSVEAGAKLSGQFVHTTKTATPDNDATKTGFNGNNKPKAQFAANKASDTNA